MPTAAGPWARLLALNADLLLNSLDGLTDQATAPVIAGGNTIAFLVAHLVDSRHFIARLLGAAIENPVAQALAGAKSLPEVRELPPLPALRAAWVEVSRHLDSGSRDDRPRAARCALRAAFSRRRRHPRRSARVPGPARQLSPGPDRDAPPPARVAGDELSAGGDGGRGQGGADGERVMLEPRRRVPGSSLHSPVHDISVSR